MLIDSLKLGSFLTLNQPQNNHYEYQKTSWRFQILFIFTPIPGEMIQFDEWVGPTWAVQHRSPFGCFGFYK